MKYNTLFLDRDGVINRRKIGGYITSVDEFEFLPGVLDAITKLSSHFEHIFVVTNQQCIGKGIITVEELSHIHKYMTDQIQQNGGRVDKIYFSPNLASENNISRKPNPGMAYQAKEDFPVIDLSKSIMVGDSLSDMQFGKNAGMKTVFLHNGQTINDPISSLSDEIYENLADFAGNGIE